MKRIALAVAVASLLSPPLVLAQSASQPVTPPAETHPQDVATYQLLLRGMVFLPTASFEDASTTDPKPVAGTAVTGAFDDVTSTELHPASPSSVTASFVDLYSGD